MASGLFFDPLVALRAAPLISTTCSLLYAWDQHFFLGLLNRPENRATSKPLLQSYFTTFFHRGLPFVVSLVAVSTWTGVANLYIQRPALQARGSVWWYVSGTALAVGHLLFVPWIAPSCQAIMEGTDVNRSLDEWLTLNSRRMLSVDLAAWAAFVVAAVKTLRV
ncbi:hypothetical protein B0J15DRAFT_486519 [Fusarium solani]|uniref:Uncharacterized protein n=1 Tax=Fusarium solani TaxID=169388 RepID=A0A9P9KTC5_FUSSL|nr:uncharacterized protein B0J15DRAFT_486519 [Fusarium solani]KAH7268275.1 hypothetical protein B0J15DRAFT_486519 [Fusarium solani]